MVAGRGENGFKPVKIKAPLKSPPTQTCSIIANGEKEEKRRKRKEELTDPSKTKGAEG